MSGRIQQQITWRTREQVARFFEGTDLVEPGLVRVEEWRPVPGSDGTEGSPLWCAGGESADASRVAALQGRVRPAGRRITAALLVSWRSSLTEGAS